MTNSIKKNLDRVLKNRDITLPAKVHILKAMYRCEIGPWRRLNTKELLLWNCGVGEDS